MNNDKVHILGFNKVEEDDTIVTMFVSLPRVRFPEGKIWHGILGRFVPKDWAEKEMWVEQEALFG